MTRELTAAAFRKRVRGQTTASVRERMAGARPFEDCQVDNLERKLACGALRDDVAALVRAELSRRRSEISN